MNRRTQALWPLLLGLLTFLAPWSMAQSPSRMSMDDGMMMGGWFMLLCGIFGVLLFVALILAILALWKYLFGNQR